MMNPGTALGIAAAQLAQQGQYKPFTSDGKPTVVNNLITQESQKEAAKQAQTAAQIEAMKQAQMQQALQQMLAQKTAPQAPLASGIGGLGKDVPMAEGGVVGYNGQTGSAVKTQAEEDKEKLAGILQYIKQKGLLPAGAAIADVATALPRGLAGAYNSTVVRGMRAAGLPAAYLPDIAGGDYSSATPFYDKYAREQQVETPAPRPMSEAETARIQEANVAPSGGGITTPTPRPPSAPRRQPPAPAAAPAAPMLPDTRESTAVNPSEAALQYAQLQGGLKELLERQSKPRERTPEELREATARKEEIERRMGEIDASKARFEQAKQERLAGQQGQGLRDLASFLSSASGAPSGLAGLGQATLRMDPILAARAAQEQQFREQELVFMDKLGERRNLVNDLRLSSLKDEAGRAREDVARLRALDMEISKLGLGLGEKRAGELATAEREREKTAATAKEGELNRATQIQVARIGQEGRAAGAGLAEQRLALQAMRADPNYAAIVKELTEAKKLAGVSSSPTLQNRLRAAEKAARDLAAAYGVTPGMMGMGGAGAPAPAGEATNDPLGIRK